MKGHEEITESIRDRIKRECLNYVGAKMGKRRVNEIIEYFRNCTLHPHVSWSYTRAMLDAPKPAAEDWDGFSDFLIERLLTLASANEMLRA